MIPQTAQIARANQGGALVLCVALPAPHTTTRNVA